MIPVGYLLKHVAPRPEWIEADSVLDICSLSGCISHNFDAYGNFWKHNGYWLFDSPGMLQELAASEGTDISKTTLFYYEAYEREYDEGSKQWSDFAPDPSFPTAVEHPADKHLLGYDVTTFMCRTTPECSPLSCNSLATRIAVNQHCLFNSLEEAKQALESGQFDESEPGPFRIFAVYHAIQGQAAAGSR